jgi:O-antigen/teichoic acid export membrane protein
MQRAFLKNLLWLQLLNWLVKPLWILWIEREIQLRMGDSWYGVYTLHFNLVLLFAVLLDAGLNTYAAREIAANGKLGHPRRMLFLRLGLGLVYVCLVLMVAQMQSGIQMQFLLFALINQILASVVLMMRAVLQGKQRFVSDSWLSVVDRLVALGVCTWMLRTFTLEMFASEGGVLNFQVAQFFGYATALVLGLILVFWRGKSASESKSVASDSAGTVKKDVDVTKKQGGATADNKPTQKSLGDWSREIVWFGIMALAMSIFTRIDVQMIQWLSVSRLEGVADILDAEDTISSQFAAGYAEIGLYTRGYRLLDAGLIFSALLSTQLLPLFSKRLATGEDNSEVIWVSLRLVLWVSLGAAMGAWFYGEPLINWLYHGQMELGSVTEVEGIEVLRTQVYSPEILNAAMIFKVLMLAFVPMSLVHVFGTYVTAAGQMRWLATLAFVCVGVNMVFNYIEIPKVGALGAAAGCLITQWVFAGACLVKTQKLGGYQWQWKNFEAVFYQIFFGLITFSLVKYGLDLKGINGLILSAVIYAITVGWLFFFQEIRGWAEKFSRTKGSPS